MMDAWGCLIPFPCVNNSQILFLKPQTIPYPFFLSFQHFPQINVGGDSPSKFFNFWKTIHLFINDIFYFIVPSWPTLRQVTTPLGTRQRIKPLDRVCNFIMTFSLFIFPFSFIPALCFCLLKFHSATVDFVVLLRSCFLYSLFHSCLYITFATLLLLGVYPCI